MLTLCTQDEFDAARQGPALLLLIGGRDCGVCQAIKPKIAQLLETEFPAMQLAYVDCQGGAAALCAQLGVFSLPVVQVYFEGKPFGELSRAFSLNDIRRLVGRPYQLYFD